MPLPENWPCRLLVGNYHSRGGGKRSEKSQVLSVFIFVTLLSPFFLFFNKTFLMVAEMIWGWVFVESMDF